LLAGRSDALLVRATRFKNYLKTQFMVVILSEAKDLEAKHLKSFSAKEILRFAQDDRQRPKEVLK